MEPGSSSAIVIIQPIAPMGLYGIVNNAAGGM